MGMTAKPTMRTYLQEVNEQLAACGGDESKQLERAMRAFSCSFARTHRKKLLRKNMISYDLGNTGRLDKVIPTRILSVAVPAHLVLILILTWTLTRPRTRNLTLGGIPALGG